MMSFGSRAATSRSAIRPFAWIAVIAAGAAAISGGCGDTAESTNTSSTPTPTPTGAGTGGAGGAGVTTGSAASAAGGGTPTSSSGGTPLVCSTASRGATRGSAIALTPDDARLITVNRDVGSVTVMSIDYTDGKPRMKVEAEVAVGGEPWQVVVDGCGKTAYVVLRKDQKVVRIDNLDTAPIKGTTVDVGSEPTGIALTPNNTKLYVSNWVDGTLSVINPATMTSLATIDLNPAIVATGKLGTVTPRIALAHPRAVAITNNGDMLDDDESVLVTEWFSLRTDPESAVGTKADINWEGLVYKVKVSDGSVSTIKLPSVTNTGFKDTRDQDTGCFPNQVASITIEKSFAYVTSTCASPAGPLGIFTGANPGGQCTEATKDADCGFGGVCTVDKCEVNNRNVKATTHPGLSIIDLSTDQATTVVLDKRFEDKGSTRMPLLQSDVGFFNGFGYVTATGTDAVFRLVLDSATGQITDVGSSANDFINLRKNDADTLIRLPIGIATAYDKDKHAFGFVNNDGAREVTALAFGAQAIAGDAAANDLRITSSAVLPAQNSPEERVLQGKRLFTTGLGRWSLDGAGWGSCAACHIDGLSDNVTWYFGRGPRQTTSLEGSFASKDSADQRIFNWTAIFDEIADFEVANLRATSGGFGAIVTEDPITKQEVRLDPAKESPPQLGLQGSSNDAADPKGSTAHAHSKLPDWGEIAAWIKTIRSPRKPRGLNQEDVTQGKLLFGPGSVGNCVGCHSGEKWTISQLFYNPGDGPNAATLDASPSSLSNRSWNVELNGFPLALLPTTTPAANGFMRFGAPPGLEQILCVLRPVGTIGPLVAGAAQGISAPEVNVIEVRQDMKTVAQGAADNARGFNPPSLLGMGVGAPYFHAGNARTLEELFDDKLFAGHHRSSVAQVFVPNETLIKQLVAYLLSIDEDEPTFSIPSKGNTGGPLCF